ncbi:MAG: hypothetical protein KY464_01385 [Gemmatimonadetes bacterium]|nr:hypothetical protein [Gemmatimonadota bacterium]
MADGTEELRPIEILDDRNPLARQAVKLIRESIGDVQSTADLLSELEERRRGLPTGGDYHLMGLIGPDGRLAAAAAGVYLAASNAGFVTYLAVRSDQRGNELGRDLRAHLVEALRADARQTRGEDLAWVVGEVRQESRWLATLIESGGAVPFDVGYFHPWLPRSAEGRYILYREPVADRRPEIPSEEVLRLLYLIWRRAYRIDHPLQSDTFCYMLEQLEGKKSSVFTVCSLQSAVFRTVSGASPQ